MAVDLTQEIRAFENDLPGLCGRFGDRHRWVIYLDGKLQGDFPSFDEAFDFAMSKFPDSDFLIRDVQPERLELPFLLVVA